MTCVLWRIAAIVATFAIGGSHVHAAIITRDFRTAGDRLLTYDTVNGREWLDLQETIATTFEEINMQMRPGGPLESFRLGSLEDVKSLANSAGLDSGSIPGYQDVDVIRELIIAVSGQWTGQEATWAWFAGGAVSDNLNDDNYLQVTLTAWSRLALPGTLNGPQSPEEMGIVRVSRLAFADEAPYAIGGYWLYRGSVPEPSIMSMLAVLPMWHRSRRPSRSRCG